MSRSRLVARNVVVTLATQLISWALTFAVMLYLPRYVGATGLGKLAFAGAFVSIFGVFVPLGTSTVLTKEIARDRSRTGELLLAAILLRIPLGLLMTGLAIGAVYALGYPNLVRTLVVIFALGMVISSVNDALGAALQGQENMPRQSAAIIIEKFLSSCLVIAFVIAKEPLWTLAAVGLFTAIVSLVVNLTAFRSLWTTLHWPSITTIRYILVAGMPFMGWGVFRTLYGQTDPVILKFITNDATVGWYAAGFRLVCTTLFLPTAITAALLPTLARLHHENQEEFVNLARRTFALVMLCGVPISLVLMLLPGSLLTLMHYPKTFEHSIPVLRIGGVGVLLWFAANVLGTLIMAADLQKKMFGISIRASVIGIPACAIFSWTTAHFWHNGATGAILSDVALEAYLVFTYFQILPKHIFNSSSLILIARFAVASIPMAILLGVTSGSRMSLWILLPCTALYIVMCLLLRCLTPQEIAAARQVIFSKANA